MKGTATFEYIFYDLIHIISIVCGVEYTDPNYKVSYPAYMYLSIIHAFVASSVYTIVALDSVTALKNMAIASTALQVTGSIFNMQ